MIRAPEQPSGWPSAIAPPLRLTFSSIASRRPRSLTTGSDCAANASFSSTRSTSAIVILARSSAFFTAGTGP